MFPNLFPCVYIPTLFKPFQLILSDNLSNFAGGSINPMSPGGNMNPMSPGGVSMNPMNPGASMTGSGSSSGSRNSGSGRNDNTL